MIRTSLVNSLMLKFESEADRSSSTLSNWFAHNDAVGGCPVSSGRLSRLATNFDSGDCSIGVSQGHARTSPPD